METIYEDICVENELKKNNSAETEKQESTESSGLESSSNITSGVTLTYKNKNNQRHLPVNENKAGTNFITMK